MLPRATSRSTPRSTCRSLNDFSRPCTWMAGCCPVFVMLWRLSSRWPSVATTRVCRVDATSRSSHDGAQRPPSALSISAMSMSWSSWPPISLRRPASSRISRAGDAVALGGVAGVLEERGVDAGVAHHQRHPVELALLRHRRAYDVLGGVDDLQEVDAGRPAELVADPDERLERRVAGAGAEAADRAVDLGRAGARRRSPCWRRRGRGSRGRGSRPCASSPISATSAATRSATPAP